MAGEVHHRAGQKVTVDGSDVLCRRKRIFAMTATQRFMQGDQSHLPENLIRHFWYHV